MVQAQDPGVLAGQARLVPGRVNVQVDGLQVSEGPGPFLEGNPELALPLRDHGRQLVPGHGGQGPPVVRGVDHHAAVVLLLGLLLPPPPGSDPQPQEVHPIAVDVLHLWLGNVSERVKH